MVAPEPVPVAPQPAQPVIPIATPEVRLETPPTLAPELPAVQATPVAPTAPAADTQQGLADFSISLDTEPDTAAVTPSSLGFELDSSTAGDGGPTESSFLSAPSLDSPQLEPPPASPSPPQAPLVSPQPAAAVPEASPVAAAPAPAASGFAAESSAPVSHLGAPEPSPEASADDSVFAPPEGETMFGDEGTMFGGDVPAGDGLYAGPDAAAGAGGTDPSNPFKSPTAAAPATESSLLRGIVFASIAGAVSTLAWYYIALATDRSFSLVAIGIGWLVGAAMVYGTRRGGLDVAFAAAVIALVSMFAGDYIIFKHWMLDVDGEMEAEFAEYQQMLEGGISDQELSDYYEISLSELRDYSRDDKAEMRDWMEEEISSWDTDYEDADVSIGIAGFLFLQLFQPIKLLIFAIGTGTAFKVPFADG